MPFLRWYVGIVVLFRLSLDTVTGRSVAAYGSMVTVLAVGFGHVLCTRDQEPMTFDFFKNMKGVNGDDILVNVQAAGPASVKMFQMLGVWRRANVVRLAHIDSPEGPTDANPEGEPGHPASVEALYRVASGCVKRSRDDGLPFSVMIVAMGTAGGWFAAGRVVAHVIDVTAGGNHVDAARIAEWSRATHRSHTTHTLESRRGMCCHNVVVAGSYVLY